MPESIAWPQLGQIRLSDKIHPDAVEEHLRAVEDLERKKREFRDASRIDPDNASVDELRYLVKHLIKVQADAAALAKQPLGIDIYSHLPVHFDPPECPVCLPFAPRADEEGMSRPVCHDCNETIPFDQERGNHGLESVSITHLHLHSVAGSNGGQIRVPYRRELCPPCFRADFKKEKGLDFDVESRRAAHP